MWVYFVFFDELEAKNYIHDEAFAFFHWLLQRLLFSRALQRRLHVFGFILIG